MKKKINGWLLPLVRDQVVAHMVLLLSGLLVSLIAWLIYIYIGGSGTWNWLYWIISLSIWILPQIGLYFLWHLTIETQYKAEVVIRGERQEFWILEGKYIIPFYGKLIDLNLSEVQKTSKSDVRAMEIMSHDKNGEVLYLEVDAERQIVNSTVYEEFEAEKMVQNETQILRNASIRKARTLSFWEDVIGHEGDLSIEDDIYRNKCAGYGITFKNINFIVRIADSASDSLFAKRRRIFIKLEKEYRDKTGLAKLTPLTPVQIKEINDRADLYMKLVDKKVYEGLGKATPIVST